MHLAGQTSHLELGAHERGALARLHMKELSHAPWRPVNLDGHAVPDVIRRCCVDNHETHDALRAHRRPDRNNIGLVKSLHLSTLVPAFLATQRSKVKASQPVTSNRILKPPDGTALVNLSEVIAPENFRCKLQ